MESGDAFWVSPFAVRVPTVERVSITLFKRRPVEPVAPVERPEVRQYRYLLRTADLGALETLHREALATLDPLIRAHILVTAQDRLLSGRELTVDDVAGLAHLVVAGEVRTPGIVVSALTEAALERLAHRVIGSPDAQPLLHGHEDWDGQDPDPRQSALRVHQPAATSEDAGVAPVQVPAQAPSRIAPQGA
jgi:hypothetical protein